ncbi:MAG: hypothetical protein ACU843_00665 [Gammaproteobacteria bacterium]
MQFAVAVIHAVENPQTACAFFCEALGFQQQEQQGDSFLINNGAISIRLVNQNGGSGQGPLNLELFCEDLDDNRELLLTYPGVAVLSEASWIDQFRLQCCLRGPHNLLITLNRTFNEDELGIIPPLPVSLIWEEGAERCIREVLKQIPLSFRHQARIRITEQAEMIAGKDGSIRVHMDHAVRSLAETTPSFQHRPLCNALVEMGIDPCPYFQGSE